MLKGRMINDDELDLINGGVVYSNAKSNMINTIVELKLQTGVTEKIDQYIKKYGKNYPVDKVFSLVRMSHAFDNVSPDVLREYIESRYK